MNQIHAYAVLNKKKSKTWEGRFGIDNARSKKVIQMDIKTGKIVSEFFSVKEAGRITGICNKNISRSILKNGTAGGFKWIYPKVKQWQTSQYTEPLLVGS